MCVCIHFFIKIFIFIFKYYQEKDTQCENFNFIDLKIINKIKSNRSSKTLSLDR